VHFRGRVQGVGFRYTTLRLASALAVTGYVQNLPDGRVRLEVEGDAGEIDALLCRVRQELGRYIRDEMTETQTATDKYDDFSIRR
jgi:acylphosphatase